VDNELVDLNYLHPESDELVSIEVLLRKYGTRRPALISVCHKMHEEAVRLITPVGAFRAFSVDDVKPIASRLPGARFVVLGACTIGSALENRTRSLFEEDPVAAILLDELGNKLVGEVARRAHRALREPAFKRGWRVGPAFRPGIGRWPVSFQPLILERLSAADLGITLTDGLMMIPQKSISFVAAIGPSLSRSVHP
jgi:hypothetical protein